MTHYKESTQKLNEYIQFWDFFLSSFKNKTIYLIRLTRRTK